MSLPRLCKKCGKVLTRFPAKESTGLCLTCSNGLRKVVRPGKCRRCDNPIDATRKTKTGLCKDCNIKHCNSFKQTASLPKCEDCDKRVYRNKQQRASNHPVLCLTCFNNRGARGTPSKGFLTESDRLHRKDLAIELSQKHLTKEAISKLYIKMIETADARIYRFQSGGEVTIDGVRAKLSVVFEFEGKLK